MSYKTAWFSRNEVHNIARNFSALYNEKHGAGQDNDCNLAIELLDRGSRNRPLSGAYGANIEDKLCALGASRSRVRELLEIIESSEDFDSVSGS